MMTSNRLARTQQEDVQQLDQQAAVDADGDQQPAGDPGGALLGLVEQVQIVSADVQLDAYGVTRIW